MRPHSKGSKSLDQWLKDKFHEYKINKRDLWNFLEEKKIVEYNGTRRRPLNKNICSSDGSSIVFKYLIVKYIQEFTTKSGQQIFDFQYKQKGNE